MSATAASRTALRGDAAIATLLVVLTAVYLAAFPRALGASDEAGYLYESKRLLTGAVLYRDVFDINAPGSYYLMALLFRVFGATMSTARIAFAVVQALIVALAYAAARVAGVRRALALPVALAQPALYAPAWPYASAHWLSTCLTMLVVLLLVLPSLPVFVVGLATGLLVTVQHHKGAVIAAGVVAVLLGEALGDRHAPRAWRTLAARGGAYAAGVLAVVLPVAVYCVGRAGMGNVVEALVLQPLRYRGAFRATWGDVGFLNHSEAAYTFPAVLGFLPVALGAEAVLTLLRPPTDTRARRVRLVLLVLPAAAAASILNFPDFIHVAFVGVFFTLVAGDVAEQLCRMSRTTDGVARALGIALCLLLGLQLGRNLAHARAEFPYPYSTPFGRVDFRSAAEVEMVERLRALVEAAGSRTLLAYPIYPALYLLTGTENPTRFVFLLPGYNTPAQLQEVTEMLARTPVSYVALVRQFLKPGDPVDAYVRAHYTREDGVDPTGTLIVMRRAG